MFQELFCSESACRRHGDAPYAIERERYLRHCTEQGATRSTLRMKANELLWLAQHLGSGASDGLDMEGLQGIARQRQSVCRGTTTVRRLIDIARPWLRFLGWWRVPVIDFRFQNELDRYVTWMRDERGLSRLTVERWQAHARIFLQWCEKTDQGLATLQPGDVDRYFVEEGARRWSRVSVSNTAAALRAFLRHAAMLGVCDARLRQTHPAGERLFVDYAGDTVPVFDQITDAERPAHIFVAALGASNYTYAEARWSEGLGDWISAHVNALATIGGELFGRGRKSCVSFGVIEGGSSRCATMFSATIRAISLAGSPAEGGASFRPNRGAYRAMTFRRRDLGADHLAIFNPTAVRRAVMTHERLYRPGFPATTTEAAGMVAKIDNSRPAAGSGAWPDMGSFGRGGGWGGRAMPNR